MLSCKMFAIGEKTIKDYPYQLLWKCIVETFTDGRDNNFVNVLPSSYKVLTRLLFLNDLLYAGHPYLSRVSSDYKEIKKKEKIVYLLVWKIALVPYFCNN